MVLVVVIEVVVVVVVVCSGCGAVQQYLPVLPGAPVYGQQSLPSTVSRPCCRSAVLAINS